MEFLLVRSQLSRAIALSIAMLMLNTIGSFAATMHGAPSTTFIPSRVGAAAETGPGARLSANYRQVLAQQIRTHSRYAIRDAMISKPYEKRGAQFPAGKFTAVCIAIFRNNLFGIVVRDNLELIVGNGQAKLIPASQCSDLSPFTELKQLISRQ
jgi:hypothetical protein